MDSFIIRWWGTVLNALRWISPFHLVRTMFPQTTKTYGFVDVWVIANLFAAVCAWLFISPDTAPRVAWLVFGYGALRVFEIVTYNLCVLFLHPISNKTFAFRSFRRSVILVLHNYCEVFFWFAAAYHHFAGHFGDKAGIVGSIDGSLYFSIITMATVGYGDITPQDALTRWMVIAHVCVSLFLTIIVIASFVSLLPTPLSLDPREKRK